MDAKGTQMEPNGVQTKRQGPKTPEKKSRRVFKSSQETPARSPPNPNQWLGESILRGGPGCRSQLVHAILQGGSTESRVNESTDQPKRETPALLWETSEQINDLLQKGNSNNSLQNTPNIAAERLKKICMSSYQYTISIPKTHWRLYLLKT